VDDHDDGGGGKELAWENEVLRESLLQYHFVHHIFHMT
jgi:hypothetical protein